MIKASIYRTCPDQVKAKGERAWDRVFFSDQYHSFEQINNYCLDLAEATGIKNPRIEITKVQRRKS